MAEIEQDGIQQTEDRVDPNGATEEESISMVEALLGGSNPDEQTEEVTAKQEEKPEEAEPEPEPKADEPKPEVKEESKPKEEEKPSDIIIGDELIAEHPVLKGLRGKSLIKDLPKNYTEAAKKIYSQGQEIKALKEENDQLKSGKKPGTVSEEGLPDPIDDEEGYRQAVREQERKRLKAELDAEKGKPEDSKAKPIMNGQEVINAIKVNLPKDVAAESIIEEYGKENADLFYDELGQTKQEVVDYFDQNPFLFIRNVITSYQAKTYKSQAETLQQKVDELNKEIENIKKKTVTEVKAKTYEQTKKNFRDASTRQPEGSEINLANRQEPELNDEERLYAQIINNEKPLLPG